MSQENTQAKAAGQPLSAPPFGARISAIVASWSIDHRIRTARKLEKKSVTEAGAAVLESASPAVAADEAAKALRDQIAAILDHVSALDAAMKGSLDKDRLDYAKASQLMRWVVVHRGLLERWIMRDRVKFHRREQARLTHDLGALAVDGPSAALRDLLTPAVRDRIAGARAEMESARRERAARLAPWNGQPLPEWLFVACRETRIFLYHVWDQLSRRLFLRVPAMGALIAGWWVASHYTDSTIERIQRGMGFGGRAHLSAETLGYVKFWAPILSAALCTYIVSAIAIRVQRKYALPQGK